MKLFNKYNREIEVITEFKIALQEYIEYASKNYQFNEETEEVLSLKKRLSTLAGEIGNYDVPHSSNKSIKYCLAFIGLFSESINTLRAHIDYLEQVIGNYIFLQKEFKRKLINPLCWIREFIRIPFHLISFAGFDVNKIEFSLLGKLYKLFSPIIFFLAALVAILSYCDIHLSDIFSFFRSPPTRE